MRVHSVTCHSFGPFADRALELAPGMNVIYGLNEAGKSSWHAALYASLCGLRRGPGKTTEVREFEARHRPWDRDGWEVSELIELEDGRRVELHHDLDGRVDCSAKDADLGRDYSNEIIFEGSPDGSRWLGLDRRSFLSTACVKQADIQAVVKDAESLQEQLQRAASTAGTDATAAAAIARLERFQKENVGTSNINSRRPLRAAINRLEAARDALAQAQGEHVEYLRLVEEVDRLRENAGEADRGVSVAEAASAIMRAEILKRRLERAQALTAKYPEEPKAEYQSDELAQQVTRALHAWENRPEPVKLEKPTAAELTRELEAMPALPDGDTEVHSSVADAKERFRAATWALKVHDEHRPTERDAPDAGGLGESDLRDLARELEVEIPQIEEKLQEQVARAQRRLSEASRGNDRRRLWFVIAGLTTLVGLGLVFAVPALGVLLMVISGALFVVAMLTGRDASRARALEELREAESRLGQQRYGVQEALKRRQAAEAATSERGLPVDSGRLAELANQLAQAETQRRNLARWHEERVSLAEELGQAEGQLTSAVDDRGVEPGRDVEAQLQTYEAGCRERQNGLRKAARRPDLEKALEERLLSEKMAQETQNRRRKAEDQLREAASVVGAEAEESAEIAQILNKWLEQHRTSIKERENAIKEWQELQSLLDGLSPKDLQQRYEQQATRAEKASRGHSTEEMEAVRLEDPESALRELREEARIATGEYQNAHGRLEHFARTMRSVPEAEEELAAAETESKRVNTLSETLNTTRALLEQAQGKVHRTVAPVLRDTLLQWLPRVTAGRYSEARVDPESLNVHVRASGGRWREARLLSHGTAEQVYLLLRMAMARHLTKAGEICPLILDDVTVQSDEIRQEAILGVLHEMSKERQIILFTQEAEVMKWATSNLHDGPDKLVQLDAGLVAA